VLALHLLLNSLHDLVELVPCDSAIAVEVELNEDLADLGISGNLLAGGGVALDELGKLVEVDVAVSVGVDVLEDEGGPLRGALEEGDELVLGDAAVSVGVDNLEEGVDLSVVDDLTLRAGGGLELVLGDLAVTVGVKSHEHLVDVSEGLLRDEGLEAGEDVGGEEGLDLGEVVVGDFLAVLLGEGGEGGPVVGVVVLDGGVDLGSGEHAISVVVEGLNEVPEGGATAGDSLGVGNKAGSVGVADGHDVVGVLGPVVGGEALSVLNSGDFSSGSLGLEEAEEVALGLGEGDETDDNEGGDLSEHLDYKVDLFFY